MGRDSRGTGGDARRGRDGAPGLAAGAMQPAPARSAPAATAASEVVSIMERFREAPVAPKPEEARHLVTFLLGDEEYGVPIRGVREILRVSHITRLPQAPAHVRGVTNVRGRVLPVLEIRTRLGLPPAAVGGRSRILVVETERRAAGLLVDGIAQIVKVPEKRIAASEDIGAAARDCVEAIAQIGDRMIILLDVQKTLHWEGSPWEAGIAPPAPAEAPRISG